MGRGVDWAAQDVAQLRQWLVEGRNPRETRAMRPDWSLDSIKTKLALHEDLQARCFKPVRAPKLTAENRLERWHFYSDVLQRVGVLSVCGKRQLKPLDLTLVVFSDEKFFRWNYNVSSQNSPIWLTGAHGRPPRKADLDHDM